MTSSQACPMLIEDDDNRASPAASATTTASVVNPFKQMMAPQVAKKPAAALRDRCFRPPPTYNDQYDPYKSPNDKNKPDYSPYDYGEPLFDDREVIIARLPIGHVVAGATKKKRTSWTWKVGYAFTNTLKATRPTIWCCKLCKFTLFLSSPSANVYRPS
jgi:hypothetical protein